MNFVNINGKIVNSSQISSIQYDHLISEGWVLVRVSGKKNERVDGAEAWNLIMELCPQALEGKQAKYKRHAWAVHNLIGHPVMQLLSWCGLTKLGLKIHDRTIPNPIIKEAT
jgi:hypothetical protein